MNYSLLPGTVTRQGLIEGLVEVRNVELENPQGWISISLGSEDEEDEGKKSKEVCWPKDYKQLKNIGEGMQFLKVRMLQIAVLASQMHGRDTHIRQIKIFGPKIPETKGLLTPLTQFSSKEFASHSCLR
jgi:anaphase-promoting complex subunit 10